MFVYTLYIVRCVFPSLKNSSEICWILSLMIPEWVLQVFPLSPSYIFFEIHWKLKQVVLWMKIFGKSSTTTKFRWLQIDSMIHSIVHTKNKHFTFQQLKIDFLDLEVCFIFILRIYVCIVLKTVDMMWYIFVKGLLVVENDTYYSPTQKIQLK